MNNYCCCCAVLQDPLMMTLKVTERRGRKAIAWMWRRWKKVKRRGWKGMMMRKVVHKEVGGHKETLIVGVD